MWREHHLLGRIDHLLKCEMFLSRHAVVQYRTYVLCGSSDTKHGDETKAELIGLTPVDSDFGASVSQLLRHL